MTNKKDYLAAAYGPEHTEAFAKATSESGGRYYHDKLPSSWQLMDNVQVCFPGNGKLQGRIIKVAFDGGKEARYDVEIPFDTTGTEHEVGRKGFFRLHGIDQYFLSHTQEDWDKMQAEEAIA